MRKKIAYVLIAVQVLCGLSLLIPPISVTDIMLAVFLLCVGAMWWIAFKVDALYWNMRRIYQKEVDNYLELWRKYVRVMVTADELTVCLQQYEVEEWHNLTEDNND